MPRPRFSHRILAQPPHSIYTRFITPTMHPHSSLARAIHCLCCSDHCRPPSSSKRYPSSPCVASAVPCESMPCPLLNQTVPSLSATLPISPVPSHLTAIPHFALAALGFAVQSFTLPWPCGALPFVTLLLPFASSPFRSGLCRIGTVQVSAVLCPLHCQSHQCSAIATPFCSTPPRFRAQRAISPAKPRVPGLCHCKPIHITATA